MAANTAMIDVDDILLLFDNLLEIKDNSSRRHPILYIFIFFKCVFL